MVRFLATNPSDIIYKRHRTTPASAEPFLVMERHVDYLVVLPMCRVLNPGEAEFAISNLNDTLMSPQANFIRMYRKEVEHCHTSPFPTPAKHPYRPRKKAA